MDTSLITDDLVIQLCYQKNCGRLKRKFDFNKLPKNVQEYIKNRYTDSLSINETINRIYYHLDNHPNCPFCGKPLKYGSCGQSKFFHQTCGDSKCLYKLQAQKNKTKYGYENVFERKDVKEKIKETFKEKYGVEHALQNKEIKQKQEQTCINKFGTINIFQSLDFQDKFKKIMISKYGVDHPMKSEQIKSKFNWEESIRKQIETKRKNHSFKLSKIENKSFELLKEKYQDVDYQYKSKLYPFVCDFYIPSLDLYIECNYHWTHGGKPFEGTEEDKKIIKLWESKNTQYYKNAINCWSIRDVNKRNVAKENNLNWIEFWNINELKIWLNKI